ncbi:Alpha/Beta hydrolase protein [Talaromyces proteolyticus]|uniref:Kynurenine formamidase n=1 Tax=Talaromyces proteolyticus TaxID=1131652 RepID=A0AAD4KIV7_9EURO|nr:Alpha/Beta hydrolase protein [Talaromyces proteolyticus]KAH8693233.1 Alpha/Beta hydrolase protein [Talaromyces proteolyticus]
MSPIETFHYGPHELQKIHVSKVSENFGQTDKERYWIVYIHGGAWRDPTILASSFKSTERVLRNNPLVQNHVAAFASIDYRLSPHPDFPQDSKHTPDTQLRVAEHPDHLHDVQAALKFLQDNYSIGENYVLVGHSCGATLAFQTVMGRVSGANPSTAPKPKAIVGACGIYDLRLLRDDFKQYGSVNEFITRAFGAEEDVWDEVSPGKVGRSDGVASGWSTGQVAVVASSTGDSLINLPQGLVMGKVLKNWESLADGRTLVLHQDLQEEHDDVWSKGQELASVIIDALQNLVERHA